MRDGILVLNKTQGWTSSDCVAVCRRILGVKGIKKVGHGGTLDPMATGVLPVFVGQATRIMEYMDLDYKTYVCRAKLGIRTDTLDIWGKILEEKDWISTKAKLGLTVEIITRAIDEFKGAIEQMPPKYSAVRIDGKRLYEYAYKDQEISEETWNKIKPRKVYIKHISVNYIDMEAGELELNICCSKGTYIRTICSELGERLGCGCTMTALERIATGIITIDQAEVTPDQVKTMTSDELGRLLLPSDYPLVHFGELTMPSDRAAFFSRGNSIWWNQIKMIREPDMVALLESCRTAGTGRMPENSRGRKYDRIYKVYQEDTGEFLGTGYYDADEDKLKADKVFVEKR
ncbi:MAG: tRNA pseudouridine(55) synthase TruB [Eubacteriales bacterium]|nr:tRNA pseudouridine(55) synthase TruB [Eubacteriales bacterium]